MIFAITSKQYHPLSPSLSEFSQKLIDVMLNKDPYERPDARSVLKMKEFEPIIKKIQT
jgi:hypothetical protein